MPVMFAGMHYSAGLLLVIDSTAPLCGQVRPVGAINVGPGMDPTQEEVMYDLVGFMLWTGGNEVNSARFVTCATAPTGT